MPLLSVEGIVKSFNGKRILDGVNMTVDRRGVAAIVGRNGSGKSTLLSIIAGVLRPDGGDVTLDGTSLLRRDNTGKHIGFVPQSDMLFSELTLWDNVKFWAAVAGVRLKNPEDCPYATLLGLPEYARRKVGRLSGGTRRRTAICAALQGDPELLALDEPFAGLDLYYKSELAGCLKSLANLDKTIIYSTHSGDEITGFATRVHCLSAGKIVYDANPDEMSASVNETLYNFIKGENNL